MTHRWFVVSLGKVHHHSTFSLNLLEDYTFYTFSVSKAQKELDMAVMSYQAIIIVNVVFLHVVILYCNVHYNNVSGDFFIYNLFLQD